MRLNELFENDYKWWMNTRVKSPTPDPRFGPDAGAEDHHEEFNILVNGRLWKKNGKPVVFKSFSAADKAVTTISLKYNKTAQVVKAK